MEFQFLHHPKPRKFNYKPRFYDAERENHDAKEDDDRAARFEKRLHTSLSEKRTAQPAESFWKPILKMGLGIAIIAYFMCSDILDNFTKYFLTPQPQTAADFDPQAGFAEEFATLDTNSQQDSIIKDEDDGVYINGK